MTHYYTGYADRDGFFEFTNVRSGVYGFQAWSNGGSLADVSTVLLENDVVVEQAKNRQLGKLTWETQGREQIFQVGELDRKALGFKYAGSPRQHALVTNCPADLTYTVGESETSDWCFGQSAEGTWSIRFLLGNNAPANSSSVLSVSLAGYSSGVSSEITINDNPNPIGNLTSDYIASDQCLYRSATVAGEWHYYEFPVAAGLLQKGWNSVNFTVTKASLWHGFMWDSILLEYA
jgi:rhamnogalacturonan endolyase